VQDQIGKVLEERLHSPRWEHRLNRLLEKLIADHWKAHPPLNLAQVRELIQNSLWEISQGMRQIDPESIAGIAKRQAEETVKKMVTESLLWKQAVGQVASQEIRQALEQLPKLDRADVSEIALGLLKNEGERYLESPEARQIVREAAREIFEEFPAGKGTPAVREQITSLVREAVQEAWRELTASELPGAVRKETETIRETAVEAARKTSEEIIRSRPAVTAEEAARIAREIAESNPPTPRDEIHKIAEAAARKALEEVPPPPTPEEIGRIARETARAILEEHAPTRAEETEQLVGRRIGEALAAQSIPTPEEIERISEEKARSLLEAHPGIGREEVAQIARQIAEETGRQQLAPQLLKLSETLQEKIRNAFDPRPFLQKIIGPEVQKKFVEALQLAIRIKVQGEGKKLRELLSVELNEQLRKAAAEEREALRGRIEEVAGGAKEQLAGAVERILQSEELLEQVRGLLRQEVDQSKPHIAEQIAQTVQSTIENRIEQEGERLRLKLSEELSARTASMEQLHRKRSEEFSAQVAATQKQEAEASKAEIHRLLQEQLERLQPELAERLLGQVKEAAVMHAEASTAQLRELLEQKLHQARPDLVLQIQQTLQATIEAKAEQERERLHQRLTQQMEQLLRKRSESEEEALGQIPARVRALLQSELEGRKQALQQQVREAAQAAVSALDPQAAADSIRRAQDQLKKELEAERQRLTHLIEEKKSEEAPRPAIPPTEHLEALIDRRIRALLQEQVPDTIDRLRSQMQEEPLSTPDVEEVRSTAEDVVKRMLKTELGSLKESLLQALPKSLEATLSDLVERQVGAWRSELLSSPKLLSWVQQKVSEEVQRMTPLPAAPPPPHEPVSAGAPEARMIGPAHRQIKLTDRGSIREHFFALKKRREERERRQQERKI
jgi:hypothetical protein